MSADQPGAGPTEDGPTGAGETPHASPADEGVDTSALDRSDDSIDSARGALADVAANDDVTADDDAQAGVFSQDPDEAASNAGEITSAADPGSNHPSAADPDADRS